MELLDPESVVAGYWNLVALETSDLHIHHIRVRNPSGGTGECGNPQRQQIDCYGPNADGIVSSHLTHFLALCSTVLSPTCIAHVDQKTRVGPGVCDSRAC